MAEQPRVGTRVVVCSQAGWHTARVARVLPGGQVVLEGDDEHVYVFPPLLTVWLSEPGKRENYKACAAAWRTHNISAVPELSMPTVEQLLEVAGRTERSLDPDARTGFLEVAVSAARPSLETGVRVLAYIKAKRDSEGVPALQRARDVRTLPDAAAAELVVGFCEAMASLLLELARSRLVHNGLLPDRVHVIDRVGPQRVTLRVGPPGDFAGEMYGDTKPYLDWFGAALCMALVGHGIDAVPALDLDATIDFGVGRRARVVSGESPRRRLMETSWNEWVPRDARFYGPDELKEAISALLAEASYCHGGYDLVVRILQICRAWREQRHRDLERLRERVDSVELTLVQQGEELQLQRARHQGEVARLHSALEEAVRAERTRVDHRLGAAYAELAAVDTEQSGRLDRLQQELGAEASERSQLGRRVEVMEATGRRVDELAGAQGALAERFEGHERTHGALSEQAADLGQACELLGARITALERPQASSWLEPGWRTALAPMGVLLGSGLVGGVLRWLLP